MGVTVRGGRGPGLEAADGQDAVGLVASALQEEEEEEEEGKNEGEGKGLGGGERVSSEEEEAGGLAADGIGVTSRGFGSRWAGSGAEDGLPRRLAATGDTRAARDLHSEGTAAGVGAAAAVASRYRGGLCRQFATLLVFRWAGIRGVAPLL